MFKGDLKGLLFHPNLFLDFLLLKAVSLLWIQPQSNKTTTTKKKILQNGEQDKAMKVD